jgi:hypothetical protein
MHFVTIYGVGFSSWRIDGTVVVNGKSIECGTSSRRQENEDDKRENDALANAPPPCVRLGGKHADTMKAEPRSKKRKAYNKTFHDG